MREMGRLMPRKAETHPLISVWIVRERASGQQSEEAFEVSIVLEAPATNHPKHP